MLPIVELVAVGRREAEEVARRRNAKTVEQPIGIVEIGADLVRFKDFSIACACVAKILSGSRPAKAA